MQRRSGQASRPAVLQQACMRVLGDCPGQPRRLPAQAAERRLCGPALRVRRSGSSPAAALQGPPALCMRRARRMRRHAQQRCVCRRRQPLRRQSGLMPWRAHQRRCGGQTAQLSRRGRRRWSSGSPASQEQQQGPGGRRMQRGAGAPRTCPWRTSRRSSGRDERRGRRPPPRRRRRGAAGRRLGRVAAAAALLRAARLRQGARAKMRYRR